MTLRALAPCTLVLVFGCASPDPGAATPVEPAAEISNEPLGTIEMDVVVLLTDRREVDGVEAHRLAHDGFRYLFASAANAATFASDPDRFGVALGGGCGRMGALSEVGRTDLRAVVDGRLYLFASEGCRRGFVAEPGRYLVPESDPEPARASVDPKEASRVLGRVQDWLGGVRPGMTTSVLWSRERERVWEGETYVLTDQVMLAPGQGIATVATSNEDVHSMVLGAGEAYFQSSEDGTRPMNREQTRTLERRFLGHVLATVAGATADSVRSLGRVRTGSTDAVLLQLYVDGFVHDLTVDDATGEVVSHRFRGTNEREEFGVIRREFSEWSMTEGVRVPVAWRESFGGGPAESVDRFAEGWELRVVRS